MLLVSSDAPVTSDQQKRRFSFSRQSPEKCQQSKVTSRAFSGACTIYVSSSVLLFPIAFALVFVFAFLTILEFYSGLETGNMYHLILASFALNYQEKELILSCH